MLHARMATVTVRVVPRAGRTIVRSEPTGVVIRVRAAPEGGRATEEARRALATALGLPPSRVRLVTGARARTKVFEIADLTADDLRVRLGGP
jgi:uncharacterized protein